MINLSNKMNSSKQILCPNCRTKMHTVETESHYGANIFLDQCPACGGLWFDRRELYRIKDGEAANIHTNVDPLDIDKLGELVPIERNLICPNDKAPLQLFGDPLFPKTIEIERCPECGGFWFNHGEFSDFQKWRSKHKKDIESGKNELDTETKERVNKLIAMHGDKGMYNSIGNLGEFLSQPAGQYELGRRRNSSGNDQTQYEYAEVIETVIITLLRILLGGF